MAALLLLMASLAHARGMARAGDDQWTSTGGPAGLIYAVVVDPAAEGVVYAGTSSAGIFKSTNGGQSWTSASGGLGTKAVLSLALDPTHPSTLYAGTDRGVYRTENGGASWAEASTGILRDPFGASYVYSLAIDPRQPSVIYAGTLMGVFRSRDGGQTWQEKNSGLRVGSRPAVEALAVDPQNTNVVYAGAGYSGLSSTVFKSQDGGDSWVPLTTGLSGGLVSSIAVHPEDSRKVYLATRGQGVLSSFDAGLTWQQAGAGVLETHIAAVAASGSPSRVIAAGMRRGFYRSLDGGLTWEQAGGGIGERGPTTLALDPRDPGGIWMGAAGGLYRSDDSGSHWTASGQGVDGTQIVAVAPHPYDRNRLFVTAWAGGLYQTSDAGASWQAVPLGVGIASALAVDPGDPNLVYAGMIYLSGIKDTGLYASHDGGTTWQLASQFKDLTVSGIAAVPGKAYVGTDAGLYISDDSGATWRPSESGLPLRSQISLLAAHPKDYSAVYLTLNVAPGDLYWSRDAGLSWTLLHHFEESLLIIAPSPAREALVYAVTGSGVLRSENGGASWEVFPFAGGDPILSLAPHPAAPDTLYLGTSQGSYRSVDGGRSWVLLGLQGEAVASLTISPVDPSRVFGGTMGRGLWSYTAVPTLRVEPGRLAFLVESGLPPPASLSVRDEGGGSFSWRAEVVPAGSWLSVSPSSGLSLPATITLSMELAGLAPGAHAATITFSSTMTGTRNSPWVVPVTLSTGPVTRQFLPKIAQGLSGW